jgi:serine/threonine-protein kinase
VYSLGCVLYEMLVGEPPFTGPTSQVVLARHIAAPVPAVTTARAGVPRPVSAAVEKALGKAPADRYPSVGAFREALFAEAVEPEGKSIAVLPFANMSPDPENEYFSDGITEEIINALTKLRDLRVAARTSSFTFKGQTVDIKEAGKKLDVATVLEGSVRRAGSRLRITAQLINVADGYHLWSDRYDREMTDVFEIQDEIAEAVVEELKVSLFGAPEGGSRANHSDDLEAYELYLRGRFFWKQRGEGLQKGLQCFQQAVERDPKYALAHVGLADGLAMIAWWSGVTRMELWPKAKAAVRRALDLDPDLPEVHACQGFISMYCDWDWARAEHHFLRAIDLNPGYMEAHLWYSQLLGNTGESSEAAIRQLRLAHDVDPLSPMVIAQLASHLIASGRVEEGLAEADRALELAPGHVNAHVHKAWALRKLSRHQEAIELLEPLRTVHHWILGELAVTYAEAGRREAAQAILEEGELAGAWPGLAATVFAALGQSDTAFEWLERSYERRGLTSTVLRWWPNLDPIRSDPRFEELVRRVGLV